MKFNYILISIKNSKSEALKLLFYSHSNTHHESLSFVGMTSLSRDDEVTTQLSGYGGGVIIAGQTQFSFSFIKWTRTTRLYINSRIEYLVNKEKPRFSIPISWSLLDTGDDTSIRYLPIKKTGVYLVTLNLIITATKGFEIKLMTNDQVDCLVKSDLDGRTVKTLTVALACAIIVRHTNSVVVITLGTDSRTYLEGGSTASFTFITPDYFGHPVLKLKMGKLLTYHAWGSKEQKHIRGYNIQAMSKIFLENLETVVPIYTGTYIVSCQIILSVKKKKSR